jgi:short-subunit dehydrogenase
MKVKDKRIIVTGAGSGIGRELTLQLLSKGAYVAALDINEQELNKTKEIANNNRLTLHIVDMANEESINKFKDEYFKNYSVIDGIINNAGIIQPFINVDKLNMDIIYKVMDVNFYGPVKLTKLFLPELLNTNVKVTLVLPGAINTNITKNSNVDFGNSENNSKIKMLSSTKAAEIIINGIEKDKFKIYVGTDSKIMNIMYKMNDKFAIKLVNKKMQGK